MDLNKIIQSRKSVRKFSDKKPDWREIIEAIDSMRYAPMAGNNFSLKFILIDDRKKIGEIAKASQQNFINNAHYILALYSEESRQKINFGDRADKYISQQAGAAIQNFLLKIEELGLSTCWIGHFVDEQIKRELSIPKTGKLEAIFPIGYSKEKNKKEKKVNLDSVLYFNKAKNKKMGKR